MNRLSYKVISYGEIDTIKKKYKKVIKIDPKDNFIRLYI